MQAVPKGALHTNRGLVQQRDLPALVGKNSKITSKSSNLS